MKHDKPGANTHPINWLERDAQWEAYANKLEAQNEIYKSALRFYEDELDYLGTVEFHGTQNSASNGDKFGDVSIPICKDKGKTARKALADSELRMG